MKRLFVGRYTIEEDAHSRIVLRQDRAGIFCMFFHVDTNVSGHIIDQKNETHCVQNSFSMGRFSQLICVFKNEEVLYVQNGKLVVSSIPHYLVSAQNDGSLKIGLELLHYTPHVPIVHCALIGIDGAEVDVRHTLGSNNGVFIMKKGCIRIPKNKKVVFCRQKGLALQ